MSRKIFVVSILLVLTVASTTVLQAQTDPGPRPVGKDNPNLAICLPPPPGTPLLSAKFPKEFSATNPCIDVVQPPQTNPLILADGAGNIIANAGNLAGAWFQALTVFETPTVVGPVAQTGGSTFPGLGPSFNGLSCFQCHSQPTVGGSSPNMQTPGFPHGNPQIGDAPTTSQLAALTKAPAGFQPILATNSAGDGIGPVREVRFPKGFAGDPVNFIDPVAAGAVANLFVIQGRPDAPAGCTIGQEPFQTEIQNHNVIFRIPIPTFGEGFVENTDDQELKRNAGQANTLATNLGISGINFGVFNHSGNDQTISRFGWKAQNKSLLIFAGEASNVEMGVTNENFPNERTHGNGQCSPNFEPEDQTVTPPLDNPPNAPLNDPRTILDIFNNPNFGAPGVTSDISSNIENFAIFMRLNGAPSQCNWNSGTDANGFARCLALDASSQRGQKVFGSLDPRVSGSLTSTAVDTNPATTNIKTIGCVLCHSDFLTTTTSLAGTLNNSSFHPYSDFALHTMDPTLADGVTQGTAGGQQFRTAPLWGLGQRLFFMHDGRDSDLLTTIEDHCRPIPSGSTATPSEACAVISGFNSLPAQSVCTISGTTTTCSASKEDVLHFLRSL